MNLDLLEDVKNIIKKNEEEINKTGKGFNLISLLGMEHNERYTHSNIIAELFRANGSHTFGNKFFKLFLEEVNITDFSTTNYEVLTEEYIPDVLCTDGTTMRTFLDIVIKDKSTGKVILIENKIWARDQHYQIERYFDIYNDKIVKLFYLNVDVWEKCPTERHEILNVFQNISYKNEVKNWLANCIVASNEKPFVSRQIETYYQTILKISNQDIYKNMNEEIKNHIIENNYLTEYYELISRKDSLEFEIVKRFVEQSCNVQINDSTFGCKNSSINLFNHNDIKVNLVFEERFNSLYLCVETAEGNDITSIEDSLQLGFKTDSTNHRLFLYIEEFNETSWDKVLENSNIESMRILIGRVKEVVCK